MSTGRPVFLKPPGGTGSLDTAAWKLLILNLEDVSARIYGRFGGADVFLDGFIVPSRVADGTLLG